MADLGVLVARKVWVDVVVGVWVTVRGCGPRLIYLSASLQCMLRL